LAVGFEIIDCPFPNWQFKPVDFVASFGLHRGLVVGEPLQIEPEMIPTLAENLPSFKVRISKNGCLTVCNLTLQLS
jgi:2-keto-4-pentenoate hydratase